MGEYVPTLIRYAKIADNKFKKTVLIMNAKTIHGNKTTVRCVKLFAYAHCVRCVRTLQNTEKKKQM